MRAPLLGCGVLAVLVCGLVTGCTTAPGPRPSSTATTTVTLTPSPNAPATAPPPSPTSSPTTTSVASPSTTASNGASQAGSGAPAGQCADVALAVSVVYDPGSAGAGQRASWVIFRNTGTTSCVLKGTPGVSLVGYGNGTQLGQPAYRGADRQTGGAIVTLPAGGYAGSVLQYTYVDARGGNFNLGHGTTDDPACKAAPADGYRIYPPHSYRAFFVRDHTYACTTSTRWITIGAVVPAARVTVHP